MTGFRLLLAFVFGTIVLSLADGARAHSHTFEAFRTHTKYDALFSKYTKRYFGAGFDWRYFKAQAIAESRLDPGARSGVGASGLMQIMPATYREISAKNPNIRGPVSDPRWNVAAGIWYNRQMFNTWFEDRSLQERLRFTFGSYNAGKGNILRAQRRARARGLNPQVWSSIRQTLPEVTGHRSAETIAYIEKIEIIREAID